MKRSTVTGLLRSLRGDFPEFSIRENQFRKAKLESQRLSTFAAMMNGKRAEETKAFVSRQSDVYCDPYAVYPADRPRQCVFGATTNRQKCLPFDHTGNRRFLPVTVDLDNAEVHILEDEATSREYINQMWAEAMDIFKRRDYTMTFSPEITRQLDQLRQEFMPEDTNAGLIQAYLDEYEGDYVCTTQLYREALRNFGEPTQGGRSEATTSGVRIGCAAA